MSNINDIISMRSQGITDPEIIKRLIDNDQDSVVKRNMINGMNYYFGKHDILNKDFRKFFIDGMPMINDSRSNYKIENNYHYLLVQQKVSYIAGNPIVVKSEDNAFQEELDRKLMFDFDDTVIEWLVGASNKGVEYVHFYYDESDDLQYTIIPSEQIIPIYKDEFKKNLLQVIRYYTAKIIDENGKPAERKKVEWWDEQKVTYYIEDNEGVFILDTSYSMNPLPHWIVYNTSNPDNMIMNSWGKVPFVQLLNNDTKKTDLERIKDKIDAIDLIKSEFVNQLADIRELLLKVTGYSGSSAAEILEAFRANGIVKIDDATGNIDVLKAEIPVEARKLACDILERDIYKFGMGVNVDTESFGGQTSGVALKFLYENLNLKCNATIRKLNRALYDFIWFIVDDYNRKMGTNINYKETKFTITKSMMINEAEKIESLMKLKGTISDQTILENIEFVTDIDLEKERLKQEEEKQMEQLTTALNQAPTNTEEQI